MRFRARFDRAVMAGQFVHRDAADDRQGTTDDERRGAAMAQCQHTEPSAAPMTVPTYVNSHEPPPKHEPPSIRPRGIAAIVALPAPTTSPAVTQSIG